MNTLEALKKEILARLKSSAGELSLEDFIVEISQALDQVAAKTLKEVIELMNQEGFDGAAMEISEQLFEPLNKNVVQK